MKIEIEITERLIADLMTSAIEGNHMTRSWCDGVYFINKETEPPPSNEKDGPWYAQPETYASDSFWLEVHEIEDDSQELTDDVISRHKVGPKEMERGFELMAKKYGSHLGDVLSATGDAVTADVWLQCVALGELRYG